VGEWNADLDYVAECHVFADVYPFREAAALVSDEDHAALVQVLHTLVGGLGFVLRLHHHYDWGWELDAVQSDLRGLAELLIVDADDHVVPSIDVRYEQIPQQLE